MQLEETFDLEVPRAAAWEAFHDIATLVSCFPGAKLASAADADPLQIVFVFKLGPITASFTGRGAVAYGDDYRGSMSGGGVDPKTNSRVKGEATFALAEIPEGTRVQVLVDYALTGALAQFGRPGIVKEIASNVAQQFAANLRSRLAGLAESQPSAPLDAGDLAWRAVKGRMKRLFDD